MKKLSILLFLFVPLFSFAQQSVSTKPNETQLKELVKAYMQENKSSLNITDDDINNWMISDLYSNGATGITYLYVHQQVKGIRIFNAVSSVSIKDGKVKSFAKRLYTDAAGNINTSHPSISASVAIQKTAAHLGLKMDEIPKLVSTDKSLNRTYYSCKEISPDNIRVELVFQPVKKTLRLAWDVNVRLADGSHWWNVRIDAVNGDVLQKNDWVAHCDFGTPSNVASAPQQLNSHSGQSTFSSVIPQYLVYPLPTEAPSFGPSSLINDPSDPTASPFGWHDTDGVTGPEFTITRGNNVFAYDDTANLDQPGFSPDGTSSLIFNFPVNFSLQPINYLSASVTNLFYINNTVHDIYYNNGFDEPSGNFQAKNYSGTGLGNDYVFAECQDGGGTDNANFATPDDGQNPRMQMYLWTGAGASSVIVVNSPAPIAGNYNGAISGFGPGIPAPITADLVLVDDGTGTITDACDPLVNGAAMIGKIALIDRGTCSFVSKVQEVQDAGAIAAIVINNTGGAPFAMTGAGGSITIPSEMISLADGNTIKNSIGLGNTVNVTLDSSSGTVNIDGSLDNGVVVHESGHGVSTRLTGGPMNSNCLDNGEEAGEGWSDFFALMFTTHVGDVGTTGRGLATFASGQATNGGGIRRYPYSTDMAIDPETYGILASSPEVHDIGELWCSTLWDLNWALIGQSGFDPDWVNGTSGNNITLKLVIEGLKLQPCSPGFLDARDAILAADDNLYGGIHKCLIWSVFARRGMGYNANEGDPNTAGDETEGFALPPACLIATQPPVANFRADITSTCFGIVHFTDSSTNIPQQWKWDFGDGDTSSLENPVHSYNASGVYNVKLVVTNNIGEDSLIRNGYISINYLSSPLFSGDTILCNGDSTILSAGVSTGDIAEWRDTNNTLLHSGNVFNTPVLTSPTTYHLYEVAQTTIQNVGPLNDSNGTPAILNFDGRILFHTSAPMRIKSVWVDAQGSATRSINLYGGVNGSTLLQTISLNIPNGPGRYDINFDIPTPGKYQLGASSAVNLYRTSTNINYPYIINGLVSLDSSNTSGSGTNPLTRYYYFYNWEVRDLPCTSALIPVNISIDPGPVSSFNYIANGLTVHFTNTSMGNPISFLWDFGNGDTSTQQNPSVTYAANGNYTVSLDVVTASGCESVSTITFTVTALGISEVNNAGNTIYFSGQDIVVKFASQPTNAKIRIYDPIGKLLLDERFNGGDIFKKQIQNLSSEFILVSVEDGDKITSKKIILIH